MLIPTTRFDLMRKACDPAAPPPAQQARNYVRRHWKYCEPKSPLGPSVDLFERVQSHFLCISGMAFQDAWNIDLERLRQCCVHVLAPQAKLVPFCVYYMTDAGGRRLFTGHRR